MMPHLQSVLKVADVTGIKLESIMNFETIERMARLLRYEITATAMVAEAVEKWARDRDEQEVEMKKTLSPKRYKE